MLAAVYENYGPPTNLRVKRIETPQPGDDEVLIRVHAATVNRTDCATIRAKPAFMRLFTGLVRPTRQIPGTDFAGEVIETGGGVADFKVGDRVFGFDDLGLKSHAKFLTVAAAKIETMPAGLSYQAAAASLEGAHYAYNFIKKFASQPVQTALVNGASGAIGSAAVQLLRHFGIKTTAVCATENLELIRSIGADRVIDYTRTDFTQDDQKYDLVFDAVGKSSFFRCQRLLKPGGVYMSSEMGFLAQNMYLPYVTGALQPLFGNTKTIFPFPEDIPRTQRLIKKLIEDGEFRPLIDREYPLEQVVEAYEYVELGQKTGNVILNMDAQPNDTPSS